MQDAAGRDSVDMAQDEQTRRPRTDDERADDAQTDDAQTDDAQTDDAQTDDERVRQERAAAGVLATERARRRIRAPWPSMVLSLGVVLSIVLLLLLLVPRVNSVTQPPVDVGLGARAAAERVSFTPSQPRGLPAGWRPTSVRTARSSAGVLMWHVGYQTPSGQYAAVQQGIDAPFEWVRAQVNRAPRQGDQPVDGAVWQRWVRTDKVQNSLVRIRDRVTTVVTGTAPFDELALLAASLDPPG
ncbi:MAG: DUF4245 domain-containing protein [Angustibacter sp.]